MYTNYQPYSNDLRRYPMRPNRPINPNNNRFFGGGFLGPFILGGITGGLLAPNFYPRPYPPYPPYPPPMPPIYY